MNCYYFDTDALIKVLIPEVGHALCKDLCNHPDNIIILSEFTILEAYSALRKCLAEKEISKRCFEESIAHINSIAVDESEDKASFQVVPISSDQITAAKRIVEMNSLHPGDSIQVAIALEYRDLGLKVVTGDTRVRNVCSLNYVETINANKCVCQKCGREIIFHYNSLLCVACGNIKTTINKAECICGYICNDCQNPKWCERIKRSSVM